MRFLYTSAVRLYALGVGVAAAFGNAKAKLWLQGRQRQKAEIARQADVNEEWIWLHAASLGEFEQGRPVIEALKDTFPQYKILLSFFSPSGFEIRKDYPLADEVLYLPTDTPRHASLWLGHHHFVAAFFIKYEFWFNYMAALKRQGIPLFYVSLILDRNSFFFKPFGAWFRKQLRCVSHFFVQDETTARLLNDIRLDNVTVSGDTRFDRVAAIARQARPFPEIERFVGARQCFIAGSTWPPDEKLIAGFLPKMPEDYALILAPHDVSDAHIAQIRLLFPQARLYSELDGSESSKILVINKIGILSQLYQYARFVYVGGGFGANIHNIQEPVTFGCPVVFGPRHTSFKEAVDLVHRGGAFSVCGQSDFDDIMNKLVSDNDFRDTASAICLDYLNSQLGATEIIMEKVQQLLFHA